MRRHVHVTTIPTSEPRPREQVETPERDRARTAGREVSQRDTTGAISKGAPAQARKPRARTRHQARHAMRSGIAWRADGGTQARQFNATPATALHAIPDHGTPRLARQPGLGIASRSRGHCCRDDPRADGRAGAAITSARARQMNARPSPRRSSPGTPGSMWASRRQ